ATKIYTRTGDKGTTSLIGGTKVPKSHLRIESYGTIDELNSFIGLLRDQLALTETAIPEDDSPARAAQPQTGSAAAEPASVASIRKSLLEIQDRLFTVGSSLACDPDKEPKLKIPDLKEEDITALEKSIDQMDNILPPMKSFVLPGGHVAVSTTHIVRCVC